MFIKQSAGLTFMIGVLLLGLAGLAGGQLWVYTGSSVLAVGAGILCLSVLLAATRSLLRRFMIGRSVRLLGELKAFDSAEFVNAVSLDDDERSPIERKAQDSPRQVAGSIQSMLSRGKTRGKR